MKPDKKAFNDWWLNNKNGDFLHENYDEYVFQAKTEHPRKRRLKYKDWAEGFFQTLQLLSEI
jgi:hypothetical protein